MSWAAPLPSYVLGNMSLSNQPSFLLPVLPVGGLFVQKWKSADEKVVGVTHLFRRFQQLPSPKGAPHHHLGPTPRSKQQSPSAKREDHLVGLFLFPPSFPFIVCRRARSPDLHPLPSVE